MDKIKKRVNKLIKQVDLASRSYYKDDNPIMSDADYDRYIQELRTLENNYPDLKQENSPTSKVGGEVIDNFKKITHSKPMLSLTNVFNKEELENFIEKTSSKEYSVEPKIDGLAVAIFYELGKLTKASTRGDGLIGEDITHNILEIKDIPKTLKSPLTIEVRGEIYMKKSIFDKLNKQRESEGLKKFANPRNAAAGSVRQLDSNISRQREITSFIYQLINPESQNLKTQIEAIKFLKNQNFQINNLSKLKTESSEIIKYINNIIEKREKYDYEIDGVVIKVNDFNEQAQLGNISNAPKWATAYKFPTEIGETKLLKIFFTIGRTGKIIPNAELEPIKIMGSTINYATLHNEDYIKKRDLRESDYVKVTKAGEIIPEVIEAVKTKRNGKEKKFQMIKNCPACNNKIIRKDGESAHYCINIKCPARNIEKLIHFASKEALNIEGLGEKVVENLYNLNIINQFSDIYQLKNKYEQLIKLDGYGEKSIDNLISSIEQSKQQPLSRFIFSLGIRQVGLKTAKLLATQYEKILMIKEAKLEELTSIKDIGLATANEIIDYFDKEKNIKEILKLKELGLDPLENKKEIINSEFNNLNVVITGIFENYNRVEIMEKLEKLGAKIKNTVSTKTDYLIIGINAGSKLPKAQELNIKTINEEQFEKLLKKERLERRKR